MLLFTTMKWQPPIGISDERKANPLIVPRTGTRALVPKASITSRGGVSDATELPFCPSSFTLNRSALAAMLNLHRERW